MFLWDKHILSEKPQVLTPIPLIIANMGAPNEQIWEDLQMRPCASSALLMALMSWPIYKMRIPATCGTALDSEEYYVKLPQNYVSSMRFEAMKFDEI